MACCAAGAEVQVHNCGAAACVRPHVRPAALSRPELCAGRGRGCTSPHGAPRASAAQHHHGGDGGQAGLNAYMRLDTRHKAGVMMMRVFWGGGSAGTRALPRAAPTQLPSAAAGRVCPVGAHGSDAAGRGGARGGLVKRGT